MSHAAWMAICCWRLCNDTHPNLNLSPISAPLSLAGSMSPISAPLSLAGSMSPISAPLSLAGSISPISAPLSLAGSMSPISAPLSLAGSMSPISAPLCPCTLRVLLRLSLRSPYLADASCRNPSACEVLDLCLVSCTGTPLMSLCGLCGSRAIPPSHCHHSPSCYSVFLSFILTLPILRLPLRLPLTISITLTSRRGPFQPFLLLVADPSPA